MFLEKLKEFQLSSDEQKSIGGGRDTYCITLHKGICETKSFCSESNELTNSWAHVWQGFGWSTRSNCYET